jgi:hypothetical protein
MQSCKGDAAEILYMDVGSVVQWHSGLFVELGVLQERTANPQSVHTEQV